MGRLTGQASLALGPQEAGVPPAIDNLPPVPGSDEAILQNSSQQVEAQESNQGSVELKQVVQLWIIQVLHLIQAVEGILHVFHPQHPNTCLLYTSPSPRD